MVCTHEDDFTRSRFLTESRWVARLTNGESVISDDGRPGTKKSAWLRLADYVKEKGVRIETLQIEFRSHVERPVPANADGYFFRTAVGAFLNDKVTFGFFLVGYLKDGKVYVSRWQVPELLPIDKDERNPDDADAVGESLIRFDT